MRWENYLISLWTHQDDFVSVLCSSKDRYKYTANSPVFTSNTSGLIGLTLSIPIITLDTLTGEIVDNSIWYNKLKKLNRLANEKRVKLIFDKGKSTQKIVLLVITNILEVREESGLVNCNITCSGLAFKWLGKIGYTITLDSETALLLELLNTTSDSVYIVSPTINYWSDKLFPHHEDDNGLTVWDTFWRYRVLMTYDGSNIGTRESDKIYLDDNIQSWKLDDDGVVVPVYNEAPIEKLRFISVSNSNKYNITQDIAELFLVFARYEFLYLDLTNPYKPTAGVVIYYNEMLQDSLYSISYGNNLTGLTRTSLSTDLVTKMYVDPILDDTADSGYISISQALGNKMRELYIFNFDYFKLSGQLSQLQLLQIDLYLSKIRKYNNDIDSIITQRSNYLNLITLTLTKLGTAKDGVSAATENLSNYQTKRNLIIEKLFAGADISQKTDELIAEKTKSELTVTAIASSYSGSTTLYCVSLSRSGVTSINSIKADADSFSLQFSLLTASGYTVPTGTINFAIKDYLKDSAGFISKVVFYYFISGGNSGWSVMIPVHCDNVTMTVDYNYDLLRYYNEAISLLNDTLAQKQAEQTAILELLGDEDEVPSLDELPPTQYYPAYTYWKNKYTAVAALKLTYKDNFLKIMKYFIKEGTWDTSLHSTVYLNKITYYPAAAWTADLYDDTYQSGDSKSWYYSGGTDLSDKKYYDYIDLSAISGIDWSSYYINSSGTKNSLKTSYVKFIEIYQVQNSTDYTIAYYYDVAQGNFYYLKFTNDSIKPVFLLLNVSTNLHKNDTTVSNYHFYLINSSINILPTATNALDVMQAQVTAGNAIEINTSALCIPNLDGDSTKGLIALRRYTFLDTNIVSSSIAVTFNNTVLLLNYDYIVSRNTSGSYMITFKPTCDCILTDTPLYSTNKFEITYKKDKSSQQLYYDALLVLEDSSKPTVTYLVSFVYLNNLAYKRGLSHNDRVGIDLGTIVRITDWSLNLKNIKGIVTLLSIDLDNPQNDSFTVANYKTKFLDLFGRILASTLAMKSNLYSYNRAASAFTSGGSIDSTTLQDSLLSGSYTLSSTADGSVRLTSKGLLITSTVLNEYGALKLIFSAQGVLSEVYQPTADTSFSFATTASLLDESLDTTTSSNGYEIKRTVLITADGINADAITAGHLNTEKINIYSGDQRRFTWDSEGLFAYKGTITDGILSTDYNTFVRYNQLGLYFIKDDVTLLSLGWDGLNINTEDGSLSLTGDKGLIMYSAPATDASRVPLLHIGNCGTEEDPIYGIRLTNKDGEDTLSMDNDGNITISGKLDANDIVTGLLDALRIYIVKDKDDLSAEKSSLLKLINDAVKTAVTNALSGIEIDDDTSLTNLANNSIKINDDGISITSGGSLILNSESSMSIESGGLLAIKSGSAFTVDSSNFILDSDGNVKIYGLLATGELYSDGYPCLTSRSLQTLYSYPLFSSLTENKILYKRMIPSKYNWSQPVLILSDSSSRVIYDSSNSSYSGTMRLRTLYSTTINLSSFKLYLVLQLPSSDFNSFYMNFNLFIYPSLGTKSYYLNSKNYLGVKISLTGIEGSLDIFISVPRTSTLGLVYDRYFSLCYGTIDFSELIYGINTIKLNSCILYSSNLEDSTLAYDPISEASEFDFLNCPFAIRADVTSASTTGSKPSIVFILRLNSYSEFTWFSDSFESGLYRLPSYIYLLNPSESGGEYMLSNLSIALPYYEYAGSLTQAFNSKTVILSFVLPAGVWMVSARLLNKSTTTGTSYYTALWLTQGELSPGDDRTTIDINHYFTAAGNIVSGYRIFYFSLPTTVHAYYYRYSSSSTTLGYNIQALPL